MKIAIVAGSHRNGSESSRVAEYLKDNLSKMSVNADIINLAGNPLPLWGEEVFGDSDFQAKWGKISNTLQESSAVIVISPEWAGMVPAALKNFFLFCSNKELAHKPGLIVSVSAGIGGSYPISELRESSYKNNRLCYIPDHVIIRSVGEMLKGESAASQRDEELRARIDYSLKILIEYAKALTKVRESGIPDYQTYPFGM